jgi:predicted ATPase
MLPDYELCRLLRRQALSHALASADTYGPVQMGSIVDIDLARLEGHRRLQPMRSRCRKPLNLAGRVVDYYGGSMSYGAIE